MQPMTFIVGFVLFLFSTTLASFMLSVATPKLSGYVGRVLFVSGFGLVIAFFSDLGTWNWWHAPFDYCAMQALDHVLGWLLAGLFIGAVVTSKKPQAQ